MITYLLFACLMQTTPAEIIDHHISAGVTSCTPVDLELSEEFKKTFPTFTRLVQLGSVFDITYRYKPENEYKARIFLWTRRDKKSMGWFCESVSDYSVNKQAALIQKEIGGFSDNSWGTPYTILTNCSSFLPGEYELGVSDLLLYDYGRREIKVSEFRWIGVFNGHCQVLLNRSSELFALSVQDGMELLDARIRCVPVGSYQLFKFEKSFVQEMEHAAKLHLEFLEKPQRKTIQTVPPAQLPSRKDAFGSTFNQIPGGIYRVGHEADDPFEMGVADIREGRLNPFWMGIHEVTIKQILEWLNDPETKFDEKWLLVEGISERRRQPASVALKNGEFVRNNDSPHAQSENHPICGISWPGAVAFSDWLSAKTGDTYRLPTQIEWEYACRAGTTTMYHFGNARAIPDDYAWYEWNCNSVMPVGLKLPNNWGLYDMAGNVEEWCSDSVGFAKPMRGGAYDSHYPSLRSAERDLISEDFIPSTTGIRLILDPAEK